DREREAPDRVDGAVGRGEGHGQVLDLEQRHPVTLLARTSPGCGCRQRLGRSYPFSHTLLMSQLSVRYWKSQFCTFDECKPGHFWIPRGPVAPPFMSCAFAFFPQSPACAFDFATMALFTKPLVTELL